MSVSVSGEQKGAGYHLDLFWVAVLMIVCSFMGLPWYVAATVISIAHIDSLKMETETSAPGEQPKFLGVRYRDNIWCSCCSGKQFEVCKHNVKTRLSFYLKQCLLFDESIYLVVMYFI